MNLLFPQENKTFFLQGSAGAVETMATPAPAKPLGVGIICHPDPRFGGSMTNKVVTTTARALLDLNLAVVRFNYRGVGNSEGEFGNIIGELADFETVLNWTRAALPDLPLWLAGFSFGSYISALGARTANPQRLISIAPPVNHYDYTQFNQFHFPWLVIQGDQDEVVSCNAVEKWAATPPSPLQFVVMPQASHFFHGKLLELREIIKEWAQS